MLDDDPPGSSRAWSNRSSAPSSQRCCDVAEELLRGRQLVRRLRRSRDRPDPTRLGAGQPRQDGRSSPGARSRPGATLRRLGTDTYSSISRPRSIAIRWTMRAYSTPIVIFTWAEALELPAQRAACPGRAPRSRRRRRSSRSRRRHNGLPRGQHPRHEPLDELHDGSLVVRLEVHGAERSLLELLNRLLVVGRCSRSSASATPSGAPSARAPPRPCLGAASRGAVRPPRPRTSLPLGGRSSRIRLARSR